jgi:LEA14-like dessication related protein
MDKRLIAAGIILIIVLVYVALYAYSLSKVEVRNVQVDSLRDVTPSGFTLSGAVEVYNGGIVPVRIDAITYNVTLSKNSQHLTTGTIAGAKIGPKQTAQYRFNNTINWVPSAAFAYEIITGGDTDAIMQGTVSINSLMEVPFERRIDLGEYLKQFMGNSLGAAVDTIKGWFS